MHQILGGVVLGSLFGEGARRTTWRPLLRSGAKLLVQVERQTSQAVTYLRTETDKLMAEARAELDQPVKATEPAAERVTTVSVVQPLNQQ